MVNILRWFDQLKRHDRSLKILIGLNIFMAIASNIVDYPWLASVKWYLLPLTPICSLYPLTLAIWFTIYRQKKTVPPWYTTFILMGIIGYGIMAQVYYPFYMSWDGVTWRYIGNMIWVAIYASQALTLKSEIKKIPPIQYLLIFGYFALKDYADRYLGTFLDILRPDFPQWHIDLLFPLLLTVHILAALWILKTAFYSKVSQVEAVAASGVTTGAN